MSKTFSESWHRVAHARLSLLPAVVVQKQTFRGREWYVLRDAYTHRFFRITKQAYTFVSRLDGRRTVEEAWEGCLAQMPSEAPGQEEVMQLLSQLHQSNLLHHDSTPDSVTIFGRFREQKRRELLGKFVGFLSIKIPLWNPNHWLNAHRRLAHWVVSVPSALLMAAVMAIGVFVALSNTERLWNQAEGFFALGNLFWLYVCIAVMKTLHELGHALVVKRFGGDVHRVGIMLLLLMPLPYVDATGSWAFRQRSKRALVGAAGIIVELVLAGLGALVWANTGPGLVSSLAFNVMVIGSVSSLLFNGNPLLRFDAYYVLSDLVDIPNMYQMSGQQWRYLADRYLLGTPDIESPAGDAGEWWWITVYGVVSFAYRLLVFATILFVLADHVFVAAVLFLAIMLFMGVLNPIKKWVVYLRSPAVERNRRRAVGVSLLLALSPFVLLGAIPWTDSIRAPGLVESVESTRVSSQAAGRLDAIETPHGAVVRQGQVLVRLSNPEMDQEMRLLQARLTELTVSHDLAIEKAPAELRHLQERIDTTRLRIEELTQRQQAMVVRAAHDGTWWAPELHEKANNWLPRGQALGDLTNPAALRMSAVISQEQANELFERPVQGIELVLNNRSHVKLRPSRIEVMPYRREQLLSPALGWQAGGAVAVRPDDPKGVQALDPFFELYAWFEPPADDVKTLDGMTGWLRIPLPSKPLAMQATRSMQQLLQKRFSL